MTVTLTAVHEQLRKDTARMFKYDYANLSAAESVRLDRAAMLRLELEDCQNKKLTGQPFDINKYIVASESLERMLSPNGTGTDVDFETRHAARCQEEFAGSYERFSQLMSDQHERVAARDASHPDEARLEFERELQAKIDKYKTIPPKPTVEWVRDGTHCFFSEGFDPNARDLRSGASFPGWVRANPLPDKSALPNADLDASAPPPPPGQTSPQPPLPPPSNAPPAGYLRRTDGFDVIQGGRYDRWSNRG